MILDKCERCSYDDVDAGSAVPESFRDRYQAICACCAKELNVMQYKMSEWSEY